MKNVLYILIFTSFLIGCNRNSHQGNSIEQAEVTAYDSLLAKKLGADDYGMKQYVMAFLKRGPNRNHDSAAAAQLQRAHLDNIVRMANEGTLVLAGPFMDNGEIRGIYIFNVTTVEEAEALTATDPAIQAGRLVMELHPWYGSAAVMQLNEVHEKIAKINI
ncbi:MAG: YciI family protein [Bacteroidales bacterium]